MALLPTAANVTVVLGMVMATEGASCSAVVSGTAKDTLLVAVAAGALTLVLVLSVSVNGAAVLVVGAVLNVRLMSEFCKPGWRCRRCCQKWY